MGLWMRLNSMLVRSWRWTSLCLPWTPCIAARVLLVNSAKSELYSNTSHDRCIRLPPFFSIFFIQVFVHLGTFWYNPHLLWKQVDCKNTSQRQLLCSCIDPDYFFLSIDLRKGLTGRWLWGRICDPSVKECFFLSYSRIL